MPELPEVETIRQGLSRLIGQSITGFQIGPHKHKNINIDKLWYLNGMNVAKILRHGKYLGIVCKNQAGDKHTLIVHLGMSGRLLIKKIGKNFYKPHKHDVVWFNFGQGSILVFNDARKFGRLEILPFSDKFVTYLQSRYRSGNDALSYKKYHPIIRGYLLRLRAQSVCGPNVTAKDALMDQGLVAGIGNIYASEILHRIKISPRIKIANLSKQQFIQLGTAMLQVLAEAILRRGSTFKGANKYVSADKKYGQNQSFLRVYMRTGRSCLRVECNGKIEQIVQSGRSTYFCNKCQI